MRIELKDVITSFRRDQELALQYLHGRLQIPVPESAFAWAVTARRQIAAVSSVIAEDGVRLRKHGFGIEVIHPDFRIDFDYGPAGECDCFDAWRLGLHNHISPGLPSPVECDRTIRDWIGEAEEERSLIRVPETNAFYVWPDSRSFWTRTTTDSG